ncbi:agamous-like MADS-box protein AGL82 [Neltuma alba]|uniref:agamous-like MADS-box protein AGL82 n=1 Tax=Neltuma alba TaxID=207710 RepID=UPI0010A4DE7F|nr:agamous-like MADS-box protein AGL82 [Prosopis alba]XP_028803139.1 agamous-like MADS-box protein AGL82 [Prosopis alba]
MEPIQNKKARKATFEGRKKSIMKKAYELSTLCGVEVCIIIYGPNNNEGQVPAQTWPQDPQDVIRIIHKYNKARIASRQPPKKYDLQDFFRDRRNKVEAERAKVDKETLRNLSSHQQNLNSPRDDELRMFVAELDARIEECDRRINMLKMMKPDHHQNNNNPRITNQNLFNVFPPTMKSAIFYPYYSPVSQNILHMQINSGPRRTNLRMREKVP